MSGVECKITVADDEKNSGAAWIEQTGTIAGTTGTTTAAYILGYDEEGLINSLHIQVDFYPYYKAIEKLREEKGPEILASYPQMGLGVALLGVVAFASSIVAAQLGRGKPSQYEALLA